MFRIDLFFRNDPYSSLIGRWHASSPEGPATFVFRRPVSSVLAGLGTALAIVAVVLAF